MRRSAGKGILPSPSFQDLAVTFQCLDEGPRTNGTGLLPSCCRLGLSPRFEQLKYPVLPPPPLGCSLGPRSVMNLWQQ